MDFKYINLEKTESTNNIAKEQLMKGHQSVVIAKTQSGGKGRAGRSFSSGEGGLYMSVGFIFQTSMDKIIHFPILTAVAACRTLESYGINVGFKWPNDIYLQGKKICGILCEGVGCGNGCGIVVGIGINISNEIPEDIAVAGTIKGLTGLEPDREELAGKILKNLQSIFADALENNNSDDVTASRRAEILISEAQQRCITIGKKIRAVSLEKDGIATGIGMDGSLKAVDESGQPFEITFGDVTVQGECR